MQLKSAIQRTNATVLIINALLDLFLFVGYTVEILKGARSVSYLIAVALLTFGPLLVSFLIYLKNKENKNLKYITLIFYLIFYIFVMFTSDRVLTYVYFFPILLMYYLYFDLKIIVFSCTSVTLINIVKICMQIFVKQMSSTSLTTDYLVQMASILLFSYSLIQSTRLSNQFNKQNLDNIEDEKQKQATILKDVLNIATIMDKNSRDVQKIVDELTSSSDIIACAVTEISSGVVQTAESIQNQSTMTKNIHTLIVNTSGLYDKMGTLSNESVEALDKGITHVRELSDKSSVVSEKSQYAYKKMQELMDKANEIQSITEIITGISEQTNMLSLNASIEAARAGENGRGFAVVADEIRKLAIQSRDSATSIADILESLGHKANRTSEAVLTLKETNDQQNELIKNTTTVFENLADKMALFNENVRLVNEKIEDIVSSNNRVIDSITEISALSQEATANAQEAGAMTAVSKEKSEQARILVNELIETSESMNKYL